MGLEPTFNAIYLAATAFFLGGLLIKDFIKDREK